MKTAILEKNQMPTLEHGLQIVTPKSIAAAIRSNPASPIKTHVTYYRVRFEKETLEEQADSDVQLGRIMNFKSVNEYKKYLAKP